jgi:hypothetical protein
MSQRCRSCLIGCLAVFAFGATATSASAAISVTSPVGTLPTGAYTATTTANQTFSAPSPFGTLTFSCAQSLVFDVVSPGPFARGDTIATLLGPSAVFTCTSGVQVTILNSPSVTINSATTTTLLAVISGIQLEWTSAYGSCLFSGNIGLSFGNGTSNAGLLGGALIPVSGFCNGNASISTTGYVVRGSSSSLFSYSGTA